METGRGIYSFSHMLEECRQTALTYYKDFQGNEVLIPVLSEHLLLKWKAYNAYCGFVELNPDDIIGHQECTLGQFLARPGHDAATKALIEPHKKLHNLAKEAIRAINNGEKDRAERYLEELNQVTLEFAEKIQKVNLN